MLTPEEVQELKSQLREQVKNLPEDKKKQALEQINSLSNEALETMLKEQQSRESKPNKGIFRMIADKDMPSKLIDENNYCVAVLDIKPITPGHLIIIPKKGISDSKLIPSQCFSLAKKLSNRISRKLKPKGTEIQTEFKFGEVILNVIPVYEKAVSLQSPRLSPSEQELDKLQSLLKVTKRPSIKRKKKEETPKYSGAIHLSRRIP